MNIEQLESYNLADAVKFHDHLNPKLWDEGENMRPEVREKLLAIAQDFQEFLGVKDLALKDITVSGSNAAYSYTPHSDIDLHLVVDMPGDEIYRELFDAKKFQYNTEHNIRIGNYDVELYVQDSSQPHHSQGIYSVLNDKWLAVPRRIKATVDDDSTRSKYEDLEKRIDCALNSKDYTEITRVLSKIKQMRQSGLEKTGEFSPENLAYKMLRNQGKIQQLFDARTAAKDQQMSLKERERTATAKKKFTYGFKEDAGLTWDGVDPTTDEFLDEDVTMTPSGAAASTTMFVNEAPQRTPEQILKDFVDFCVAKLGLEGQVVLKLKRDPEWSKRNRTFGRFIPEKKIMEVAWGNRHIMDVLRTVAHELTHQRQHEVEDVPVDAGATGSRWENEANSLAGVIMRDYASEHPECFASSMADSGEGNEVFSSGSEEGVTIPALMSDNARGTVDEQVDDEFINYVKSRGGDAHGMNITQATLWKKRYALENSKLDQGNPEAYKLVKRLKKVIPENASGYIPTKKQAKDPRYEMALSVDVKPGAVGKNANAFMLNTDKQGHPQIAKASGAVERMAEQLAHFKRTGKLLESTLAEEELDEVKMSPGALKKFAASPEAEGMLAGFEAELIFRNLVGEFGSDGETEIDFDSDENLSSFQDIRNFFGADMNSDRQIDRLIDRLNEEYVSWASDQSGDWVSERQDEILQDRFHSYWNENEENLIRDYLEGTEEYSSDEIDGIIDVGFYPAHRSRYSDTEAERFAEIYDRASEEARDNAREAHDEDERDSAYEEAYDEFWDEEIAPVSDFLAREYDDGLASAIWNQNSDIIDWPYFTTNSDEGWSEEGAEWLGEQLSEAIGMPVVVSNSYHSAERKPGTWIIEPDSSLSPDDSDDMGVEIVSPPMPLAECLTKMKQLFDWIENSDNVSAYANSSTGFHMAISLPGQKEDTIDYTKLALFLGDQHILKQFGREANGYAKSAVKSIKSAMANKDQGQIDSVFNKMKSGLNDLVKFELPRGFGKYTSINPKDNYIEFRSPGGEDYIKDFQKSENTMLRLARAMAIAGDPNAEKQEYAKKLYNLISPDGNDSVLSLFSKFASGEITGDQLKKTWAQKTLGKENPHEYKSGTWKVYARDTGSPVPGHQYSGYTYADALTRAWQDIEPNTPKAEFIEKFNKEFELRDVNTNSGRWIVFDRKTNKPLEIINADYRGGAVDAAHEKYDEKNIEFFVEPYNPTPVTDTKPSRRVELAKQIVDAPKKETFAIQNKTSKGVWSTFTAPNLEFAQARAKEFLASKGIDPDQYEVVKVNPKWEIYDRKTGNTIESFRSEDQNSAWKYAQEWAQGKELTTQQQTELSVRPAKDQ